MTFSLLALADPALAEIVAVASSPATSYPSESRSAAGAARIVAHGLRLSNLVGDRFPRAALHHRR